MMCLCVCVCVCVFHWCVVKNAYMLLFPKSSPILCSSSTRQTCRSLHHQRTSRYNKFSLIPTSCGLWSSHQRTCINIAQHACIKWSLVSNMLSNIRKCGQRQRNCSSCARLWRFNCCTILVVQQCFSCTTCITNYNVRLSCNTVDKRERSE